LAGSGNGSRRRRWWWRYIWHCCRRRRRRKTVSSIPVTGYIVALWIANPVLDTPSGTSCIALIGYNFCDCEPVVETAVSGRVDTLKHQNTSSAFAIYPPCTTAPNAVECTGRENGKGLTRCKFQIFWIGKEVDRDRVDIAPVGCSFNFIADFNSRIVCKQCNMRASIHHYRTRNAFAVTGLTAESTASQAVLGSTPFKEKEKKKERKFVHGFVIDK